MESELLNQLQKNIKELLAKSSKPLTLPEAAQYLGLSISCLYKLTSQNLIKHYKPGKRIYFKTSDLDYYIYHAADNEKSKNEK